MKENWGIFKNQFATQMVPLLILMLNVPLDISVHRLWCVYIVVILLYIQFYVPFVLNINFFFFFAMLPVLNRILWLTVSSIESR